MKKQKKKNKENEKEYLMMREEILQYLEEYQTVRNMMYLVTATCLGFAIKDWGKVPVYLFLLPLIVIVPSYIIAIDYWKCVVRAATYLIVFHEIKTDRLFRWETRHYILESSQKNLPGNVQLIPYYVCGLACFSLYFFNIESKRCEDVLVGIILFLTCIFCICKFRKVKFETFISEWEKVKQKEMEKS